MVTLSPPTSEAGVRSPAQPQVGKLVVACRWSAVYSTEGTGSIFGVITIQHSGIVFGVAVGKCSGCLFRVIVITDSGSVFYCSV